MTSVEALQISRDELLAGLSIDVSVDSEQWIPNSDFYQVLRRALELSGDPALGLHIGEHEQGHFTAFGAVGLLMSIVPTFREAMMAMARFHEVARDEQDVSVSLEAGALVVEYRLFDASGPVRSCLTDTARRST